MSTTITTTPLGFCLVAKKPFARGEVVLQIIGIESQHKDRYSLQLGPETHLHPLEAETFEDRCALCPWIVTNHSCDANVAVVGRTFVALRDIQVEEPITFDYETTEWEMAEPFECGCGATTCRGQIRGFRHLDSTSRSVLSNRVAAYLLELQP